MSVVIRPAHTRADLERFIRLPWRLYRDEPNWVPPLLAERRRFFDHRHNPYFHHAEVELFLAMRDGRPVGRIAAHIDHLLNEFKDNRWGLFGFFECERDPEAADALLATAERWLGARGRDAMVGPLEFSTNQECGLLVEGHDRPPQILETWHHPYYADLLAAHGLERLEDLLKWELNITDRERMLPVLVELADRLEPDHGIRIRHLRMREFRAEVERWARVYRAAWEPHLGFVAPTDAEVERMSRDLRPIVDPDWVMFAERDGEVVGAAVTLPDWNQVLARLDGRLLPLGWLRALWGRRRIDAVRVFALGVLPEFQHTGVAAGLYVEHFAVSARTRIKRGEMGWILESNTAMNRGMEAMNGRIVKRYRLYRKSLEGVAAVT